MIWILAAPAPLLIMFTRSTFLRLLNGTYSTGTLRALGFGSLSLGREH
jgi:hypothetical protein